MPQILKTRTTVSRVAGAMLNGGLLTGCLLFGSSANAALTFSFDYSANAVGVGFDDAITGAARKAALTNAGTLFSNMFGTFFNHTATIVLQATSTDVPLGPMGGTLASAGTQLILAPGFGGT